MIEAFLMLKYVLKSCKQRRNNVAQLKRGSVLVKSFLDLWPSMRTSTFFDGKDIIDIVQGQRKQKYRVKNMK